MKVLKFLALIYLFSLIALLIVVSEDPGCINSITVQSINIEREGSRVSVPSCYFDEKHSGTPVLEDKKIIENISNSIVAFEELSRINKYFYKPNSIRIIIKGDAAFEVSHKEIIMSFNAAKDLSLVKKSLVHAWMLSYSTPQLRKDAFLQEVAVDIFNYAFWNELQWDKEPNLKRWLKYVYSDKDICSTNFSPVSRTGVCQLMSKSETKEFDQISVWSLRPLVVNRIVDMYDRMKFEEKSAFVNYMIGWALTYESSTNIKPLNLKNISAIYNDLMNLFIGDLYSFNETLSIDFVFELLGPQPYSMITQKSDLPFYMTQNILFGYDDDVFINLRNGSRFVSKDKFVRHWVKIQDTFPSLDSVKAVPAEYLTILQAKEPYDIFEFYKKIDDVSNFPWPEEFDSLTLYVPSLKLLGRLAPKELRSNQDIRHLMLNPQIEKILGWNPVQVY